MSSANRSSTVQIVNATKPAAKPFLKWTGGKQWLALLMTDSLQKYRKRHYVEPFLGGGAIFFALHPETASLSDSNEDLIVTYRAVRDNVDDVIEGLSKLKNDKATFLKTRSSHPQDRVARAIRFIYLNKTAFNGMYRVNQRGEFNVPFGDIRTANICQEERLRSASEALSGVSLRTNSFATSLRRAKRGDLVYLDPPYVTTHNNNGFIKYNAKLFSWSDQKRLASAAEDLRKKGVVVVVSNAAHDSLLDLYPNFYILELDRNSLIAGRREHRGFVTEALICSFPIEI